MKLAGWLGCILHSRFVCRCEFGICDWTEQMYVVYLALVWWRIAINEALFIYIIISWFCFAETPTWCSRGCLGTKKACISFVVRGEKIAHHLLLRLWLFNQIRYFEWCHGLNNLRQQQPIATIGWQIGHLLLRLGPVQIVIGPVGVDLQWKK